jgi:hypothetical protein
MLQTQQQLGAVITHQAEDVTDLNTGDQSVFINLAQRLVGVMHAIEAHCREQQHADHGKSDQENETKLDGETVQEHKEHSCYAVWMIMGR